MTELDQLEYPRRLPRGYTRELVDMSLGVYWHLRFDGERVNGGLAASEQRALEESRRYALAHMWSTISDLELDGSSRFLWETDD